MTREEMIALALASGFKDKHMEAMFYESGPYELSFPTAALESFYRAAFAAGQTEMRERQVSLLRKNAHTFARNLVDEARALPIDGELVGSKGENECTALREALAQPEPEPVVPIHQWRKRGGNWIDADHNEAYARIDDVYEARTLYLAPPVPKVPKDLKLAPSTPTKEMLNAYRYSLGPIENYKAMLAAAPEYKETLK